MCSLINDELIFLFFFFLIVPLPSPFVFWYNVIKHFFLFFFCLIISSFARKVPRTKKYDTPRWYSRQRWVNENEKIYDYRYPCWILSSARRAAQHIVRESRKINFLLTQCRIIASNLLLIRRRTNTFHLIFGTSTTASFSRSSSARQLATATSVLTTTLEEFSWFSMHSSVRILLFCSSFKF